MLPNDSKHNAEEYLLILALDRLIKQQLMAWVYSSTKKKEINQLDEKEIKLIKFISEHNKTLISNVQSDIKASKHRNKKLLDIGKLYIFKPTAPAAKNPYWKYNIQSYINSRTDIDCPSKNALSIYFYKKLNAHILNTDLKQGQTPTQPLSKLFQRDRLIALFKAALPAAAISNWAGFENNDTVQKIIEDLRFEIGAEVAAHKNWVTFTGHFFSKRKRKLDQFIINIEDEADETNQSQEREVEITFSKTLLQGHLNRKEASLTIRAYSKDGFAPKQAIIMARIQNGALFKDLGYFHGIYLGDATYDDELFSCEFIATKDAFWGNTDNAWYIKTMLSLRRYNFRIKGTTTNTTSSSLAAPFLRENALNDGWKNIIKKILEHQMVFFNYGKGGNILLSKIEFDAHMDTFYHCIIPSLTKEKKRDNTQIVSKKCNLSANDKDKRIIATIYDHDENLDSIVSINLNDANQQTFTGAFIYFGGRQVFTTYITAVISGHNKDQKVRELKKEDILGFKQDNDLYQEALDALEEMMKKNKAYIGRAIPSTNPKKSADKK